MGLWRCNPIKESYIFSSGYSYIYFNKYYEENKILVIKSF